MLSNFRISTKIMAMFGVLAVIVGLSIWFACNQMLAIDGRYTNLIEHEAKSAVAMARARAAVINAGRITWRMLAEKDAAALQKMTSEFNDSLDGFKKLSDAAMKNMPQFSGRIAEVQKNVDAYRNLARPVQQAMTSGDQKEALKAGQLAAEKNQELRDTIFKLVDDIQEAMTKASDDATAGTHSTIKTTVVAIASGFVATLVIAMGVVKFGISKPVSTLASSMRGLASGNLETVVDGAERQDEVGDMAKAVLVFKENGLKARALEAEAAAAREVAERNKAAAEAERAAVAKEQAHVVEKLGEGLSRLAQRDLTLQLSDFPDAYKQLERDFNAAKDALRETVTLVMRSSTSVRSGSDEVSSAADELAKRTAQQAASLEETSAALEQITATGKKAAEGASHARDVVAAAHRDAEDTGGIVRRTIEAMSGIEKSAQQITQIISVIDEIAFQTNLLALNAGVEAARAGDAGRGFAVVASEVRALAQRSAEAAKEIKGLISTSTRQVSDGVELVATAGEAVERILAQVNDINAVIIDIAAGAEEQATGLMQVNSAITQMDQATQQNAAMVEESTAASHSLAKEANQLTSMIAQFRTGDHTENVVPMARPARATAPAPVSVRKSVGRGGAAVAKVEQDWAEF